MEPVAVALEFVCSINAHNADGLYAMMTPDHRFIDGMGTVDASRDSMRDGWRAYFEMVPDYRIDIERMFATGDTVAFFGIAGGTYTADGTLKSENYWSVPVALIAETRGDMVSLWRVYADNEPIRRLIARAEGASRCNEDGVSG